MGLLQTGSEWLFPSQCAACQRVGPYLCADCYDRLEFTPQPLQLLHHSEHLTSVKAMAGLGPELRALIHAFKYRAWRGATTWAAECLYQHAEMPNCQIITSVPMHPSKLHHRGYDQAGLLAQGLATRLQIPYQALLIKTKNTAAQARQTGTADRSQNQHHVFALHPDLHIPIHSEILLIDDVITTGATVSACADQLARLQPLATHCRCLAHGS